MDELLPGDAAVTIKRIGFFRELRHGQPGGPRLAGAIGKLPPCDLDLVVHYLETAPTLAATGSLADDVLNAERTGISKLEVATDGEWAWPRDLAYYVREYRAELPDEFIRVVESRGGVPPTLDHEALDRVEAQFILSS
jgi:hypothetical protein